MKIINFGSINIDHVYSVPHFVQPGETLASHSYQTFAGGKGLNQSVALGKALPEAEFTEVKVYHAGKIGPDGEWLRADNADLRQAGVDTSNIEVENKIPTGHAIIQVLSEGEKGEKGQNCILLVRGANQSIQSSEIDNVLDQTKSGDIILLQNEINAVSEIIEKSYEQGLRIVLNPAPFDSEILKLPLDKIDILILNETEGEGLTNHRDPQTIVDDLSKKLPNCTVILTLGKQGVMCRDKTELIKIPAKEVEVVDTTAAGDTFIGYFVAEISQGTQLNQALITATQAAAICVTREGAAVSIPTRSEVTHAI
jgi:ribokinase